METPGEPRTGPLGAPYPASFASGHLEREKLVKLEGQPRWGGVEGGEPELGLSQGQGGGDGWANPCSGLVPPPRTPARPAQDPRYDVPGAGGVQAGGSQRPGRTVSLRERLLLTRPVWLQLRANEAAALHVLRTEPPGVSLSPPLGLEAEGRGARGWTQRTQASDPCPLADISGTEV